MFNGKIIVIEKGSDVGEVYTIPKNPLSNFYNDPEILAISVLKAREGKNAINNSVVFYIDGECAFIFMMGSVVYGFLGDKVSLLQHLYKIREKIKDTPELRNRTILHFWHSGLGHYELVQTTNMDVHDKLIKYINNKLF